MIPDTAVEGAVFVEADDTVLRMEFGIHPLNHIVDQRRLVVELTERPQNPVAILVTGQREVLPPQDALWKALVVDLVLHLATPCYMITDR